MPRVHSVRTFNRLPENAHSQISDGNLDGDGVVTRKKGRQDKTYVLEVGENGYPVLPACDAMDLDTKKAVIRAFLTWHYSGSMTASPL
jgi:hypothetical protein